jgi:hypothetical protein
LANRPRFHALSADALSVFFSRFACLIGG